MKTQVSPRQLCGALLVTIISLSLFPCITAEAVPKGWADGWSAIHKLAVTSLGSGSPAVVIDSTDIFHAIFTNRSVTEHWFVYKQIDIDGVVLQSQVIYRTRFVLSNPQLALDRKNNLHLVWEEHQPGHRGIYHIHFVGNFISFPPRYSIARVVGLFKSISASVLLREFPDLKRHLWGGEFWEDGYFARTVGDKVTADVIRKYIRYHQEKEQSARQLKLF